ncbi:hypothetical protein D9M71_198170 [compost metagenome]
MQRHATGLAWRGLLILPRRSIRLNWLRLIPHPLASLRHLQIRPLLQPIFMLEHPLPQPRAFAAGRHFLRQHPGIAAPAGEVRHDRPQQQHHHFHMALGDVVGSPGNRLRIVPPERVMVFVLRAFPGNANAIEVVLADAG